MAPATIVSTICTSAVDASCPRQAVLCRRPDFDAREAREAGAVLLATLDR